MQAAGENLSDGRVRDHDRLKRYGQHIYTESVRLRGMIDKLLDVAKADAGETILERSPVRLRDIAQKYIQENETYIKQKGYELDVHFASDEPPVTVDQDSIQTVISNLVENALKYSADSHYIGIFTKTTQDGVSLTVKDKGIGIPSKAVKHIFDKFYRVEETLTAHTKGHGLGLSIVKHLVEINQGEIEVNSESGKGSSFSIRFPKSTKEEISAQRQQVEDAFQAGNQAVATST
jgi:signal transduction histidine kinase